MKSSVINSTLFGLWKEQLQNGSQVLLLKMALVPLVILGKQEFNTEGSRALVPLGVCALLHSETREHAHVHTHRVPFARTHLNKVVHIQVPAHVQIYL